MSLRLIYGTGCFLRHVRWRGVNVLCTIFINKNIKRYCHLCVSKDWPINRSIEILRKDLICWRVEIHVMYRTVCMHFAHNINLHCKGYSRLAWSSFYRFVKELGKPDYVLVIKQLGFQQAIKIWIMHKSPLPKKKCKRVGLRVFGCFWNFTAVIVKHTGASTALISSPGSWPGHCIIGIYTESCPAVKGFPIDRLTTFIPSAYCEFWIYWLNVNMTP